MWPRPGIGLIERFALMSKWPGPTGIFAPTSIWPGISFTPCCPGIAIPIPDTPACTWALSPNSFSSCMRAIAPWGVGIYPTPGILDILGILRASKLTFGKLLGVSILVTPPPGEKWGTMPDSCINICFGVFSIPGDSGRAPASSSNIWWGVFNSSILNIIMQEYWLIRPIGRRG